VSTRQAMDEDQGDGGKQKRLLPLLSGLWSVVFPLGGRETLRMARSRAPMIRDELDGVVSELCARFPNRSRNELENVVTDVYEQLATRATITAHLIPLTLNRSRRVLSAM
jgi:hypothetical protein